MESYIKGIAVFKSEDEKRTLKLQTGLNIITGLSQTGKSAIYDIVDWCLGSDKFVIPKGVISKFSKLYAILINIKGVSYLIARKGENEKRLIYFQIINREVEIDQISLSDFKEEYFLQKEIAIRKIEDAFNLSDTENQSMELDFYKNTKSIGIRSSLAFIYQHQGIIADKFKLFFHDPTKNYFPVLAGWKSQADFAKEKQLEKLNDQIRKIERNKRSIDSENEGLWRNLITKFFSYQTLIGEEVSNKVTLDEIILKTENFPKTYELKKSDKIHERQLEIQELLKPLRKERTLLNNEKATLQTAQNEGEDVTNWLKKVKGNRITNSINICPICNTPNLELNETAKKIIEAEQWVEHELNTIGNTKTCFKDEIERLNDPIKSLTKKIKDLQTEYDLNKEKIDKTVKQKPIEEQIFYAQREVIAELNFLKEKWKKFDKKEFAKLLDEQETLQIKVSDKRQDINDLYHDAAKEIEVVMNFVVQELYFEHQPANLKFHLNPTRKDNYELYHHNEVENDKIYLNQMGSASNYLACHLGLFVAFLCYFSRRKNAKVPSLLFLDQPSQVYFTSGKKLEEDDDIARVKKIYDTLLYWINFINEEMKFKPQIIVSDHIDHLGENAKYLKGYFRANWRDNKGFI